MRVRRSLVSLLALFALVAVASPAAAVVDLQSMKGIRKVADGEQVDPGSVVLKLGAIELVSVDYRKLPGGGDGAGVDLDLDDGGGFVGGDDGFAGAVPEPGAALVFSLGALVVGARVSRSRLA